MNIAASLSDELNKFYGHFEAHNTAHTERAPTADAEAVSTLSVSVVDVTQSFRWVNIQKAVGSDTYLIILFVDYSSAFNTIVPAKLVIKLQTLGLNKSLCSWILDFLSGRRQVVRMGNITSSPLVLNTGAPQGCVLSPLLYSLYTHDCTATHRSNVLVKFAGDTTVVSPNH